MWPLWLEKNSTSPSVTVITPRCERKDIITQAVCYAKCTIMSSNYFISETSADSIYELAHAYEPCEKGIFSPSWARCQGHGKLYGKTYIEKYLDDIKQMFEYGEVSSSDKMNASKIGEQLILKYSSRFSLPGEIEI